MKSRMIQLTLVAIAMVGLALAAFADDWTSFTYLGDGVSVSFARVTSDTYTWKFRNDLSSRITYMKFRYSYVDANSGILQIERDVLPGTLRSGEVFGGWSAFTSNSRVPPTISILEIERN